MNDFKIIMKVLWMILIFEWVCKAERLCWYVLYLLHIFQKWVRITKIANIQFKVHKNAENLKPLSVDIYTLSEHSGTMRVKHSLLTYTNFTMYLQHQTWPHSDKRLLLRKWHEGALHLYLMQTRMETLKPSFNLAESIVSDFKPS